MKFILNNRSVESEQSDGLVLLDFLREHEHLIGTRAACREGDCGACLILLGEFRDGHLYYRPVNSCLLPLGRVAGRHIVTIEGLSHSTEETSPLQQALVTSAAIQCGFCTPGIVMAITAFLMNATCSSVAEAIDAVSGNLCRCTGYMGIKRALHHICNQFDLETSALTNRVDDLIRWKLLPDYFGEISERLAALPALTSNQAGDAVRIAGGTDLFVQKPLQLRQQTLSFLPENEGVEQQQEECVITAATRIETLRVSPLMQNLFNNISEDLKLVCCAPVRQQATVGGNIVNASPIGDISVFLLALDAKLTLASTQGRREVSLRRFFKAYKQIDLRAGEDVIDIRFRYPETPLRFSFEKVSKRAYLDIASVNSAMLLKIQGQTFKTVHISAGGVAPIPLYLQQTATFLQGQTICVDVIKQALSLAQQEISPIADSRGSIAYKCLLLRQLLIAHFLKLLPEALRWEDLR